MTLPRQLRSSVFLHLVQAPHALSGSAEVWLRGLEASRDTQMLPYSSILESREIAILMYEMWVMLVILVVVFVVAYCNRCTQYRKCKYEIWTVLRWQRGYSRGNAVIVCYGLNMCTEIVVICQFEVEIWPQIIVLPFRNYVPRWHDLVYFGPKMN